MRHLFSTMDDTMRKSILIYSIKERDDLVKKADSLEFNIDTLKEGEIIIIIYHIIRAYTKVVFPIHRFAKMYQRAFKGLMHISSVSVVLNSYFIIYSAVIYKA